MKYVTALTLAFLASIALSAQQPNTATRRTREPYNEAYESCLAAMARTGMGHEMGSPKIETTCQSMAIAASGVQPSTPSTPDVAYQQCLLGYARQGMPRGMLIEDICVSRVQATTGQSPSMARYVTLHQPGTQAAVDYNGAYEQCLIMIAITHVNMNLNDPPQVYCMKKAMEASGQPPPQDSQYQAVYHACLVLYALVGASSDINLMQECAAQATYNATHPEQNGPRTGPGR